MIACQAVSPEVSPTISLIAVLGSSVHCSQGVSWARAIVPADSTVITHNTHTVGFRMMAPSGDGKG